MDSLWKMENVRNRFSSVASKKEHRLPTTVILAQGTYVSLLTSRMVRVNSSCLSCCLWHFVRQQQKILTIILALRM